MPDRFKLQPADDYVFHLQIEDEGDWEGPMDLLLYLIEREELPITSVSLVQVTGQYLAHLERLEELKPDGIAEFLVMAARLLQIKSTALLPQIPSGEEDEEEEDPAEALARQLREYKLFKDKAGLLREMEETGQRSYVRLAPPPKFERHLEPGDLDISALLQAVYDVLSEVDVPPTPVHAIAPLEITVTQCIDTLQQQLRQHGRVRFRQLLAGSKTRTEILVHFLAVLEMIKLGAVQVQQSHLFGDILITASPTDNGPGPVGTGAEG